jgi:release factor glutamine methyltransferase
MKRLWLEQIRSHLEKGEIEDLQSALGLASFHLDCCEEGDVELVKIIDGINKNIPIPYIIGYTQICGLKIVINKNVLNPGPETVTLIEKTSEYINRNYTSQVLDLCTGSGAVASVLASKCKADIIATDISEKALALAKLNSIANGVNINFKQGDLFEPVKGMVFDVITSNPPYVKSGAISSLPRFVRDFAPLKAIDGGEDGLFFHRAIMLRAKEFLHPGGSLFLECEDGQDGEIENLAINFGWQIKEKFPNRHGKIRGFRLT